MGRRNYWAAVILGMIGPLFLQAQSLPTLKQVKDSLLQKVAGNPDLLNDAMGKYLLSLKANDERAYTFIRDLNLNFKTFQAENQTPGLGFSYKYDNSWSKINAAGTKSQSWNINLAGNVAFKKIYNPSNFLESKGQYNGTFFWGGFSRKNTKAESDRLFQDFTDLSAANRAHDAAKAEAIRKDADFLTRMTDQYYLGVNGSASFESNQDFSKHQFVPSLLINAGAKAWDKEEALQWFNFPDYPFAFLRMLTGTSKNFELAGASFPSVLGGLDYVIPGQDSLRKAVSGKLDPYTRLRFEAAFKTEVAAIGKQVIWFSADYRWFHQLGAGQALVNAHIDEFNYFTCNLASNNGFFVNYSSGKLPFDVKSSSVYGVGFRYDLGNWGK